MLDRKPTSSLLKALVAEALSRGGSRPARPTRIRGAALLGFAEAFDGAYGDPRTATPYVTVRPLRIGETLLPFYCLRCSSAIGPIAWAECADRRRRYNWCPTCRGRFVLDRRGTPVLDRRGAEIAAVKVVVADSRTPPGASDALNLLGADPT